MKTTAGRIQAVIVSHPRLVISLLLLLLFFASSGGAAALDVGGFDGGILGDVGTTDSGGGSAGPTDP